MKIIISSFLEKKLLLLQRNELQSKLQKKIRKFFGRYLYTNIFVYIFNSRKKLEKKSSYLIYKEFLDLVDFIPKEGKEIIDIGCGLGIINIPLYSHYNGSSKITLIDKNFISKKIKYGFNSDYEGYNYLNLTEKFLTNNGIDKKNIRLIDADKSYKLNIKANLIISLISMGYHYPFLKYIDLMRVCSSENTKFIFDIATEYNSLEDVRKYFKKVSIIKVVEKKHQQIRVCCQYIK